MEKVARIAVLVNPAAGNGTGARVWERCQQRFEQLFSTYEYQILLTKSQQHAEQLGEMCDVDLLVSVSGDGMLHDIAQGILRRPRDERPLLAVVPIGSGNDFARTLGMSFDPCQALEQLATSVRVDADVGLVNGVHFLETLSFGVDAAVALNTVELRRKTNTSGTLLYAHAAVLAIARDLRANHVRFEIDGHYHDSDLLIFAIQNGPTYGGGFRVAPAARIDDGLFNVCTATYAHPVKALYYLARMKNGNHERLDVFTTHTAQELILDFDQPVPAQCDGESLSGTHFEVSLLQGALPVLVPTTSPVLP